MIVTVQPDADAPRVKIETTATTVTRVEGTTRTVVRGVVTAGVIYDYEVPQETPVAYDDGLTVSGLVEMPALGLWLVHLGDPALSRRMTLSSHDQWVSPSQSSTVDVPGGDTYAVTFTRPSDSGQLTVKLWSRQDVEDFKALVADGSVLFMPAPYDLDLGPGYVALGDVSWVRVGQRAASQYRFASFPIRFVRRPEVVNSTTSTIDSLSGTIDSLTGTIDSLGA